MCRSLTIVTLIFLFGLAACYPFKSVPVGLILKKDDVVPSTVIRYALWSRQNLETRFSAPFSIEVITETVEQDDAMQVDRAVCRLLRRGVVVILASVTSSSYPVLVSYSNELQIPLLSPELPEVPSELSSRYGISILPSSSRAVLDLLRLYKWQGIVYIYDDDFGAEKLQRIFLLGYRILKLHLVGMLRVSTAEEANLYLRKLDTVRKDQSFHVILDTEPSLARDIIVRHVHDIHVRKTNFHFLLKQPTLEEFWFSKTAEFGVLNVTGFLAIQPDWPAFKNFKEDWSTLSPNVWEGAGTKTVNISTFFYYDAAILLFEGLKKYNELHRLWRDRPIFVGDVEPRDCRQYPPTPFAKGKDLATSLKATNEPESLTGKLRFDESNGRRKDFVLNVVEASSKGYKKVGTWSDNHGLWIGRRFEATLPTASALKDDKKRIRIATKLSPPYMMLKQDANVSGVVDNDGFEGYCKDLIDLLALELNFEYQLDVVEDGHYGKYHEGEGKWKGLIGDVVSGKADMAVSDLIITGRRQRVVDFTDPFQMISFSVIAKHPRSIMSTSSPYFFLLAFEPGVWVCVLAACASMCALFYFVTRQTGEPDSLESATGMWGRKFSVVGSVWFFLGSSVFQSTGIYPRSMSSRLLGGTWWFFALIITSLYIASITTQLRVDSVDDDSSPQFMQLQALSLEAIIKESMSRGWPKVGLLRGSSVEKFIKKSTLPIYMEVASYVRAHPEVMVDTIDEGIERVRSSDGGYILILASSRSQYLSRQKPCDTVAIYDSVYFASFGIATPLGSMLGAQVKEALTKIQLRGTLGHLHRKWWIDTNQCRGNKRTNYDGTLHSVSGLFYFLLAGMLILAVVSGAQYFWKKKEREGMRRQLSFEDMNVGHTLPLPPPEMLLEPPTVEEDSRVIDGWAERNLVPTSFGQESRPSARRDTPES